MDRRLFLQIPLVAASLPAIAQQSPAQVARQPFGVKAGEDRFNEQIFYQGNSMQCKLSARDTAGGFCIFHNTVISGPPLHYHEVQDEWFFVTKGRFLFQIGHDRFEAGEGESLFGPRMIPHTFANIGGEGQLLAAYQPAGEIEAFFHAVAKLTRPDPAILKTIAHRHRIEFVGPPIGRR